MTTDQLAFLAKIIDSPDDDLLRLVYADWLQEHDKKESVCPECNGNGRISTLQETMGCTHCSTGPYTQGPGIIPGNGLAERAEFIRVQIELAKYLPVKTGGLTQWSSDQAGSDAIRDENPAREKLERRLITLLETGKICPYGEQFDFGYSPGRITIEAHIGSATWFFGLVYGLIEIAECPLQSWLTHDPSIVREHPIQKVVCTDKEPLEGDGSSDWFKRGTYHWWRGIESNQERRYVIGAQIHNLLFGERQVGTITVRYPSIQAAKDDLSQALIRHAKEKK